MPCLISDQADAIMLRGPLHTSRRHCIVQLSIVPTFSLWQAWLFASRASVRRWTFAQRNVERRKLPVFS